MYADHVALLCCPRCHGDLQLVVHARDHLGRVASGRLFCPACVFPYWITDGIPRFVPDQGYVGNFGVEWSLHAETQYDSRTGLTLSRDRFFEATGWPSRMDGETVLEVGCGGGRFTEIAAGTGATVLALDYSEAVEASYRLNGRHPNVLIVQASLYEMPIRPGTLDRVFCFGVVQHTPDVEAAVKALVPPLKPGGSLSVDCYRKQLTYTLLQTKHWVRPFTRRMAPDRLYRLTHRWIDLVWPLARVISKIPRVGHAINWRLLVPDYSVWGVTGDQARQWAYLDVFDMLSPAYDSPQTPTTIRRWLTEAGLVDLEVGPGHNGVVGRGRAPGAHPEPIPSLRERNSALSAATSSRTDPSARPS